MNSSSTRFAVFEILRIIIPGAYFIFLAYTMFVAFGVGLQPFATWEFGIPFFMLASIIAGLSFYSKETPKRRKAFQENQPSLYILDRSREIAAARPLTEDEARRLYFYILNHLMPVTVHDKIFFFGMIYHVMINIRRTSFWFGIAGIAGLIVHIALFGQTTIYAVSAIGTIWLVYALNVRHNKADRKMQENYQDQIFWLEMNKQTVDTLILQRTQLS
ncbi:MAG: hypothetical protein WCX28_06740 [Bacteriovoracaceae bacterium]